MPEARKCVVKMRDPEGIEHAVQVQAGSLYEAASLGLKQFRRSEWSREATFEAGMLQVEVCAQINFWAELAVEDAQTATLYANRASGSIGEAFRETFIEIVAHLRFELEVLEGHKTKTRADTRGVGIGLSQPQIVGKNADLDVFGLLSGRARHEPAPEK